MRPRIRRILALGLVSAALGVVAAALFAVNLLWVAQTLSGRTWVRLPELPLGLGFLQDVSLVSTAVPLAVFILAARAAFGAARRRAWRRLFPEHTYTFLIYSGLFGNLVSMIYASGTRLPELSGDSTRPLGGLTELVPAVLIAIFSSLWSTLVALVFVVVAWGLTRVWEASCFEPQPLEADGPTLPAALVALRAEVAALASALGTARAQVHDLGRMPALLERLVNVTGGGAKLVTSEVKGVTAALKEAEVRASGRAAEAAAARERVSGLLAQVTAVLEQQGQALTQEAAAVRAALVGLLRLQEAQARDLAALRAAVERRDGALEQRIAALLQAAELSAQASAAQREREQARDRERRARVAQVLAALLPELEGPTAEPDTPDGGVNHAAAHGKGNGTGNGHGTSHDHSNGNGGLDGGPAGTTPPGRFSA